MKISNKYGNRFMRLVFVARKIAFDTVFNLLLEIASVVFIKPYNSVYIFLQNYFKWVIQFFGNLITSTDSHRNDPSLILIFGGY